MRQPFSYGNSAAGEALVSADNENGREKDSKEQIFFRQEQGDKNSYADPEYNKADRLFHMSRPPFAELLLLYICGRTG